MVSFKVDIHPKGCFVHDSTDGLALEAGLVMHHILCLHSDSANVNYVSALDSTTIQLIALYSVVACFWPEVCRDQHYNQCVVVC